MREMGVWNLVIAAVWVPLFAWVLANYASSKRKRNSTIEDLRDRVQTLETDNVNMGDVRTIVKEEIKPLLGDYAEIKSDMKVIAENVVQLRIEQAAANARGKVNAGINEHSNTQ